jgi:hypothetical protein
MGRKSAGRNPAQQEFVANDLPVDEAQLRLQVQAELPAPQRMPQLRRQPRMFAHGIVCVHCRSNIAGLACRGCHRRVHRRAFLAAVLHVVEGTIGLLDQAGGVGWGGVEHRHADAARTPQLVALRDERPRERRGDAPG